MLLQMKNQRDTNKKILIDLGKEKWKFEPNFSDLELK